MLIQVIQNEKSDLVKSSRRRYNKDIHRETHLINTLYILGFPIWQFKKLIRSTL